ncbi:predicted protein [Nematostella vectensis]|uniref:G-protein coupled receptors family 1 profile domain-containing protein n=1 Tax=Nematostella vectensis TaxID=45351 RepID=A7SZU5_NEMVE|nr:uncharacterized protein LOC5501589 [Nematostella vectensis]EDO30765.1 predicted protein [Nematostella vectensis]|eukprot:XP_001622865.1 predicted protein [Nematostella vectensis]
MSTNFEENCFLGEKDFFRSFDFHADSYLAVASILSAVASVLSVLIACSNGLLLAAISYKNTLSPPQVLLCALLFADCLVGVVFLPLFIGYLLSYELFKSCTFYAVTRAAGCFTTITSFFILVAISCERYVALFWAFRYPSIVTVPRVLALVIILYTGGGVYTAEFMWGGSSVGVAISIFIPALGLIIIAGVYFRIFKLVKRHKTHIQQAQCKDPSECQRTNTGNPSAEQPASTGIPSTIPTTYRKMINYQDNAGAISFDDNMPESHDKTRIQRPSVRSTVFPRRNVAWSLSSTAENSTGSPTQRKLAVMMSYLVGVSLVCFTPFAVVVFARLAVGNSQRLSEAFSVAVVLLSTNSLVNPCVYCWKNQEIQQAVRALTQNVMQFVQGHCDNE